MLPVSDKRRYRPDSGGRHFDGSQRTRRSDIGGECVELMAWYGQTDGYQRRLMPLLVGEWSHDATAIDCWITPHYVASVRCGSIQSEGRYTLFSGA